MRRFKHIPDGRYAACSNCGVNVYVSVNEVPFCWKCTDRLAAMRRRIARKRNDRFRLPP